MTTNFRIFQRATLALALLILAPWAQADREADMQAIREANLQRLEAIVARDVDKLQALYTDDAFFMVPNAPPVGSADKVGATWRDLMALPEFRMTHAIVRIEVAQSGDLAMDIGSYSLSFEAESGRVEDSGKYMLVWKRVGDQWRIAADMFNSNGPGG